MKKTRYVSICFTDIHFPYQCDTAIEVLKKVLATINPDYTCCLGDVLDCSQFSAHDPTYGLIETQYDDDLNMARSFF